MTDQCIPNLRPMSERFTQSLLFETGGLLLSLPFFGAFSDQSSAEDLLILLALTAAVLIWTPAYNAVFDWAELRRTGRLASNRPQVLRAVHAALHEGTAMLVSLPILIWLAGMDVKTALIVDLGLSALYAVWAWAFYLIWDLARPISPTFTPSS